MSSPVQLSDLPSASTADPSDLMLIRKGLTDFKVAVSVIQNINIEALNPLPNGSPIATDKMLLSRVTVVGSVATRSNYYATFSQVGFPKSTKMWFYCNSNALPPNWSMVPDTGDRLLAVATNGSPPVSYAGAQGGVSAGTWQQEDHALTIAQLPEHAHQYRLSTHSSDDDRPGLFSRTAKEPFSEDFRAETDLAGQNEGHNHGNTWRPLANVGCIGNKDT